MLLIPWVFAVNLTFAEAPTAVVDGTWVRGQALLPLTPERVLAQLRDSAWEGVVSGNFASAVVEGQDGHCQLLAYVAPNVVLEDRYTLKRCPTADGFQDTNLKEHSELWAEGSQDWRTVLIGGPATNLYACQWELGTGCADTTLPAP